MSYRLKWRLVGRAGRLLDAGEIDDDLTDQRTALQALNAFLLTFALWGRKAAGRFWWGRRLVDADMEVRVVLRRTVDHEAGREASQILVSRHMGSTGGENDSRRTTPAAQGSRRSEG